MTPLPTHPHKSNSKWKVHFKEGLSDEHVDFHHEICRNRLSVALLLLERLAADGSPCKEVSFCPLALHQIVEKHWMVFMDFFLLIWIIREHFAMAMGRRRVAAAQVNLSVVRWSQQASLSAMMSHAGAGQYEIIICLQYGLCFVLFCLAKGETMQKVNSLKLILKVLWKTREILTRKKGNNTSNEI